MQYHHHNGRDPCHPAGESRKPHLRERYRPRKLRRYFRGDAAFARPEIYEFLEAEGYA